MYDTEFILKNNLIPKKCGKLLTLLFLLNMLISLSLKSIRKIPSMMTRQKLLIALINFLLKLVTPLQKMSVNPSRRLNYLFKKPNFTFHSSRCTQRNEIFYLFNSINPNKGSGADNINPFFLRLGAVVLAPILSIYV